MDCQDITEKLADHLAGTLTDEELAQAREHLAGCATCRAEVEAFDDTWHALGLLPPERPDSAAMRARFDGVLEGYVHGTGESRRRPAAAIASWWQPRLAMQVAAAALLVAAGVVIGRQTQPSATPPDAEIAALRQELGGMRQMVTLSLLQQQSASERLRGVTFTNQIPQPGSEVVNALIDALMHDANTNVRLASVDALRRFADRETVRSATVDALPRQTSPLVQIALIDFLLEETGAESAPVLRRLSADDMLDAAVRARAARGLAQLGVTS